MKAKLVVSLRVYRETFCHENYIPSDDIFALVVSGRFKFSAGGVTHFVGPLEGALFRKGVLYHREVTEALTMYLFRYKSDLPVFLSDKVVFKDTARISSTLALFERLDTGVFKNDFEYRIRLFMDIVTQHEIENGTKTSLPEDSLDKALAMMASGVHRKLYLPELSEAVGLSYTQFSRRFKAKTGMTPSDYMAMLRLGKAKQLLSDSKILIRDIAVHCGFENEYYFSNFFKKMTGTSPREFRSLAEGG